MRYFVYALCDPRTDGVRYIGQSSIGMERPWAHGYPSKVRVLRTRVNSWIKHLQRQGLSFSVCVLEVFSTPDPLSAAEKGYIQQFAAAGCDLTNLTEGGEGVRGWHHSAETKAKISAALRVRVISAETRKRISDVHRGRRVTAVGLERMRIAARKRQEDPKRRIQISRSQGGRPIVDQHGRRYETTAEAARIHGLSSGTLHQVLNGQRRHTHGFVFRYAEEIK